MDVDKLTRKSLARLMAERGYILGGDFWTALDYPITAEGDSYIAQVFIRGSRSGNRPPGIPNNMVTPYDDPECDFYMRSPEGDDLPDEVEHVVDWYELERQCFAYLESDDEIY